MKLYATAALLQPPLELEELLVALVHVVDQFHVDRRRARLAPSIAATIQSVALPGAAADARGRRGRAASAAARGRRRQQRRLEGGIDLFATGAHADADVDRVYATGTASRRPGRRGAARARRPRPSRRRRPRRPFTSSSSPSASTSGRRRAPPWRRHREHVLRREARAELGHRAVARRDHAVLRLPVILLRCPPPRRAARRVELALAAARLAALAEVVAKHRRRRARHRAHRACVLSDVLRDAALGRRARADHLEQLNWLATWGNTFSGSRMTVLVAGDVGKGEGLKTGVGWRGGLQLTHARPQLDAQVLERADVVAPATSRPPWRHAVVAHGDRGKAPRRCCLALLAAKLDSYHVIWRLLLRSVTQFEG